ncbi:MAG: Na+/H+ antiporter NhaA [Dehalococcoidia bacterium]|nr:Na+/H+ antiporter NhaA [Dehalococcoidia bacterium]
MAHVPPRSRGTLRAQADRSYVSRAIILPVQKYMYTESIGGIVLLIATVVALGWANSPWREEYHHILEIHLHIDVTLFAVDLSIEEWINDGLMALFFFVIGLEIKREVLYGQLSTLRSAALPAIAAIGGMVVPASIYLLLNLEGEGMRGWGIPMATDIAFALGVLALLGRRIPMELRVFMLGLAVVDDLGAIAVIAVAYTETIDFGQLGMTAGLIAAMILANRLGLRQPVVTAALAFLIWVAVLKSGVHATVAGVLIAGLTPARSMVSREEFANESEALLAEYRTAMAAGDHERADAILGEVEEISQATEAPLERLERLIHPWSSYVILPLFALANAGIEFSQGSFSQAISSSVTIGVFAGLLLGKLVGITLFPFVASRLGIVELPRGISWLHVTGVALVGGIGFTVAIFVTGLAFDDHVIVDNAKMGILAASLVAGLVGYGVLRLAARSASSSD